MESLVIQLGLSQGLSLSREEEHAEALRRMYILISEIAAAAVECVMIACALRQISVRGAGCTST